MCLIAESNFLPLAMIELSIRENLFIVVQVHQPIFELYGPTSPPEVKRQV